MNTKQEIFNFLKKKNITFDKICQLFDPETMGGLKFLSNDNAILIMISQRFIK